MLQSIQTTVINSLTVTEGMTKSFGVTLKFAHLTGVKAFHNMVVDDMLADFLRIGCFVSVSLMLFYARGYLELRGMFRGEKATIVRKVGDTVTVRLPNSLIPDTEFEVQQDCLTSDGKTSSNAPLL